MAIRSIVWALLILGPLCSAAGIIYEIALAFLCGTYFTSCEYSFTAIVVIRVLFWLSAQVIATIGGKLLVNPLKETKHPVLIGWIMVCTGVCGPILLFLGYETRFQQLLYFIPIIYFVGLIAGGWYLVKNAKQFNRVPPTLQPPDEPVEE